MRFILTALILLSSSSSYAIESDQKQHLIFSFMISSEVYLVARYYEQSRSVAITEAMLATMGAGYLKELTDKKVDHQDLKYDMIGAVIAPIFIIRF